jgi:hypothetical protein
MDKSRELGVIFFEDLQSGFLKQLVDRVKSDDTLMLAPRGTYINIYYRGGSLLKLEETRRAVYAASFDPGYNKSEKELPPHPPKVAGPKDVEAWIDAFPALKSAMDRHFASNLKQEREFQQLVARENNRSPISNETEYFITDIETDVELSGRRSRIDMLALKWRAGDRRHGNRCGAVLIEMKYGDKALKGSAGLKEHLEDIEATLKNATKRAWLCKTIAAQFNQLKKLDLFKYNPSPSVQAIESPNPNDFEVVVLLANHNPRATQLNEILDSLIGERRYTYSDHFKLRFYVASFAGYGMHDRSMQDFDKFRTLVRELGFAM